MLVSALPSFCWFTDLNEFREPKSLTPFVPPNSALTGREIMKRHTSAILKAFWLGMIEFRSDFTSNCAGQEEPYDRRREIAHRLTMRHFEPT